ncbi:MAG: SGNH/GDSL hydrolase family protein [Candidatus Krumholzibacteriia bacterium]
MAVPRSILPRGRLRAGAKNLALSLGALVVLLAASELIVRAYYYPENLGTVIRFDPELGWSLRPDTRLRSVDYQRDLDFRIEINSLGIREREIELSREKHGKRILFLGDSVAFGEGVEQAWRLSDFLGRALGNDAEVINAGVPGWGNDQELIYLESRGWLFEPDVVVLTLTMANDVINNMLDHLFLASAPKPRFVLAGDSLRLTDTDFDAPSPPGSARWRDALKKSRLLLFVKRRLDRVRYSRMAKRSVPRLHRGFTKKSLEANYSHWSVYQRAYGPELEGAWRVTEAIVRRMAARCEVMGAELVVFGLPARVEVDDAWRRDMIHRSGISAGLLDMRRPYARLGAFCRQNDIAFLYPLAEFKNGLERRYLYFEHDNHPNRFGHALAARVLAEELKKRYGMQFHFVDADLADPGVLH